MKQCSICQEEKDESLFSKHRPECKACEHRRPSYLLKSLRHRLKYQAAWYSGIHNDLTYEDVASMGRDCYFCGTYIDDGASLHRLDHTKNYTVDNTVIVHKSCHAKFGNHNRGKNPKKGFGSIPREKAREIQAKGLRNRWLKYNKLGG